MANTTRRTFLAGIGAAAVAPPLPPLPLKTDTAAYIWPLQSIQELIALGTTAWEITPDGIIRHLPLRDWMNEPIPEQQQNSIMLHRTA